MPMTSKQIADAKFLWNDGMSSGDIAAKIGVTRSTICGYANRHRDDFPRRDSKKKPARKASDLSMGPLNGSIENGQEAARMWLKGFSVTDIVEALGSKPNTIKSYISRNRSHFPRRQSTKPAPQAKPPRKTGQPESRPPEKSTPQLRAEPVTIFGLGDRTCRFPLSGFAEKSGPGTLYCGSETVPGKSWCREHAAVVFDKAGEQ